ncbi:Coatomer subunit alpha-2 [Cardamine amara subsp. amara]|uniref:Coatomer subunit alpha-2 n=1 Tax=Cardamine amara subsp. amara TaxID=228776 RepID=A0ABD0Z8M8_CARAN
MKIGPAINTSTKSNWADSEIRPREKHCRGNNVIIYNVKERVKILENAGLLPLAYITASVHGLYHERLASQLGDNLPTLPEGKTPKLLLAPTPVVTCIKDWPLVAKGDKEHVEDTEMVGKTVGGREVMLQLSYRGNTWKSPTSTGSV